MPELKWHTQTNYMAEVRGTRARLALVVAELDGVWQIVAFEHPLELEPPDTLTEEVFEAHAHGPKRVVGNAPTPEGARLLAADYAERWLAGIQAH